MGSKNCPETPRQRMISMMYLVLTALLALNVSKDILNAFVVVNDSIVETNRIFKAKVDGNYSTFEAAYKLTPEKVRENYEKAKVVREEANKLVALIDSMKYEVVGIVEGLTGEEVKAMETALAAEGKSFLSEVENKDNYDKTTNYFFEGSEDGTGACKVAVLKNAIVNFKKKMNELLGSFASAVTLGLDVEKEYPNMEGDGTQNWQVTNFYHTILAADVVLLNKLVLEVRNAEADVVAQLYSAVSADDFSFDQVGAKVIAKSNYVLVGDEYEAEIFVAAYDSKQQPTIVVGSSVDSTTKQVSGDAKTIEGENGVGIYKVPAGSIGEQKYGGVIKVISKSGAEASYPFSGSYIVAAPSATVSADKMNVFYIGVDNPVTISAPGVPMEKVQPSISGGSLSGGNGKYIVRVTGGSKAVINVSANLEGGARSMGSVEFRIKPLPTPVAYVAGRNGGNYTKAELLASPYVTAVLENFDFDLRFNVASYTFVYKNAAGDLIDIPGSGYVFNQNIKNVIQGSRRGDRFWVDNIIAVGPTGNKNLGSVSIRITQ